MIPLNLEATRESSHCDRPAADSPFAPTAWRGLLKMVHLCRKVVKLVEHTQTYTLAACTPSPGCASSSVIEGRLTPGLEYSSVRDV